MRGEWLKLVTVRSPKVLVGISVATTWLIAGLSSGFYDGAQSELSLVASAGFLALMLVSVLGVQILAQEYRFSTIRTAFTAVPVRRRIVGAKVGVGAILGALTGAVAVGGAAAIVGVVLSVRGYSLPLDGSLVAVIVAATVVIGLAGVFGIGIGAVTRNPAFGITLVLLLALLVEPLVVGYSSPSVTRWLPMTSAFGAMSDTDSAMVFTPWYLSALVFAGWSAAAVAIGGLIIAQRDA